MNEQYSDSMHARGENYVRWSEDAEMTLGGGGKVVDVAETAGETLSWVSGKESSSEIWEEFTPSVVGSEKSCES